VVGGTGLNKRPKTGGLQNRLRIIGGKWRGRKLDFPDVPGLRPTPDRVRETLFNWLQADIVGSRCLDLFAGSGALGLEALSRGAARAALVDESRAVTRQLEAHLHTLECSDAVVVNGKALEFLQRGPGDTAYDVVLLDPPFRQGLVPACAALLEEKGWLAPNALIYLETESELHELPLPEHWEMLREKVAGQVCYRLAIRRMA
jgi:16S rRNA (guanine966-N2)-methyltransferase